MRKDFFGKGDKQKASKPKKLQKEEEEEDEKSEEMLMGEENNNKEREIIKCSLKEHFESDAIIYCQECRVYMCNKCEKTHSSFLKHHHLYNLDKNIEEIFTGLCLEKKHSNELEYFCKTHNKLICAACISNIKSKKNGKHKYCKVFGINKIKDIKKKNLEENIKNLEELSKEIEETINGLKKLYEKINNDKEKLKEEIQKIFTKIRNSINTREDQILMDVDKKFSEIFFKEDLIKESEKIPGAIKACLEKGKIKEDDWNDENKIIFIINDCINIENNIKKINLIKEGVRKANLNKDTVIEFKPDININDDLLKEINKFGEIFIKKQNENSDNELEDINFYPQ